MRAFFRLALLVLLISRATPSRAVDKPVIIKGKFKHYDSPKDRNYIDLEVADIIKPTKQQARISDSGEFEFNVMVTELREVSLSYARKDMEIILLVHSGDSIFVAINNPDFVNDVVRSKSVSISGRSGYYNQLIHDYLPFIDSLTKTSLPARYADNGLPIQEYKKIRVNQLDSQLNAMSKRFAHDNITDRVFNTWAFSKITYMAGVDLSIFPFIGKKNPELTDHAPYFDFTRRILLNNPEAQYFFSYIDYIKWYEATVEIICNVSNAYETEREAAKLKDSIPSSLFPLYFDLLQKKSTGVGRQYLLTCLAVSAKLIEIKEGYQDSLKLYIPEEEISKIVQLKLTSKLNIYDCINALSADTSLKSKLQNLFKDAEGKVVYIDFWFTNCSPCMRELPHYNDLVKRAGEGFVFLFLGAFMDKADWQKTVDKYKLQGRNYLLGKNEIAFFESRFDFSGFPHHCIIGKDGKLEWQSDGDLNITDSKAVLEPLQRISKL